MFSSNTSQTSGGYEIQRSLRFNSADTAFLNRTPASAGNRQTWTWSAWVKRAALTGNNILFSASNASNTQFYINLGSDNTLAVVDWNGATQLSRTTTQVFRDASAWYHIVFALDTTQATASNRARLYVNGVEVTAFSTATNPSQNYQGAVNTTAPHALGRDEYADNNPFDGYMTEVNFIDGQALTPSSFGAFDAQTGVWGPTRYAGSYGTNGFYLNFSDNSNTTAATLGRDYSGNSNNWTPNNFSVSAGAGNDSLVDVPTNWGTDTGVGGSVRGNYCTLNAVNSAATLSNGNLDGTSTFAASIAYATFGASTGKWYWEVTPGAGSDWMIGIGREGGLFDFRTTNGFAYYSNGQKFTNNAGSSYGSSFGASNVIGVALDMDAGTLTFFRDGVSQGVAFSGLSGTFFPALQNPGGGTVGYVFNFGQRPFAYTAPSGFRALNTQNLPTPTIGATTATQAGKFFNPVLYTGNGSTNNITGVGFETDFVWFKCRNVGFANVLMDRVRGITNGRLFSNNTDVESTSTTYINSTNSDGFQLAVGDNGANGSGQTYVAWNWKANGTGVTNTAGSITSTVSANTTSGFSVVTFAAAASSTVGHGLGVAPSMVVVKSRTVAANFWLTYHVSTGPTGFLAWNTTDAFATNSTVWNNTAPTSSVFTIGSGFTNASYGNCVAYCFSEIPGYSRFGSYTGNGSADGPFVFCGFRPAYVMFKRSSGTGDWGVFDVKRNTFNSATNVLFPNLSNAEVAFSAGSGVDILSNGFKIRSGPSDIFNASGSTHIFAAFAEAPQKFSLAR